MMSMRVTYPGDAFGTQPRPVFRRSFRSVVPGNREELSESRGGGVASGLLAFQVVEYAVEHGRHRLHFVVGQLVEEVALDSLGVRRCRLLDGAAAGLGQPHHQTPSILGT